MTGDTEPAGVSRGHDQALGAVGGHDLVGDQVDDVLDADDLGQRGGEVGELVQLSAAGGVAVRMDRRGAGEGGAGPPVGTMRTPMPLASG